MRLILLKFGIFSITVLSTIVFQAEAQDLTDRYEKAMKKCVQISDKIAQNDRSSETTSSTTTCGPVATILGPSWIGSFSSDWTTAFLPKNAILNGAARFAADQEAGRPFDDTGAAILRAAHELVRQEYGLDDEHQINRLIIDLTAPQRGP